MSIQEPSKCCVCGDPTTKRCQACAKSGIDLFFCSPEHQKLVWKHHKHVCGANAHPFRYPPLSQDELDGLLAFEHELVTDQYRDNILSALPEIEHELTPDKIARGHAALQQTVVGRMLERRLGWPAFSYANIVRFLSSSPATPNDAYRRTLFRLRYEIWAYHLRARGNMSDAFAQTPFWSNIALFDLTQLASLAVDLPVDSLVRSQYLHSLVVLVSLAVQRLQDCTAIPLAYLQRASEQILACFGDLKPGVDEKDALAAIAPLLDALRGAGVGRMEVWRTVSGRLAGSCT